MRSPLARLGLTLAFVVGVLPLGLHAQTPASVPPRVSVVYTGRSLGALGARRQQDEHELLTEQAHAEGGHLLPREPRRVARAGDRDLPPWFGA
ncbi:MAG: hypothetical protein ACKOFO_04230 [Gemmatimonadota bacterium]